MPNRYPEVLLEHRQLSQLQGPRQVDEVEADPTTNPR